MEHIRSIVVICLLGCLFFTSCGRNENSTKESEKTEKENIVEENIRKDLDAGLKKENKESQEDTDTEEVEIIQSVTTEPTIQATSETVEKEASATVTPVPTEAVPDSPIDHSEPVQIQVDEDCIDIPDIEVDLSQYLTEDNGDHTIEIIPDEEIVENESGIGAGN